MWNLLLWTLAASAADLASEETWALDAPANDVEAVTRDGVPYVVVATRSEIVVLDAAGSEVSSLPRGAEDAAAYDADGDGAPDLAICAADGLWLVPWTGSGLADPIQADTAPCEALVAHDLDGLSGVAAADGSTLALWWADGAGGLGAMEVADAGLDGDPRLAVAPGKLAAASLGGSTVWDRDGGATEAGGIVADVGADASGWLVALWDARTVGPLGGTGADVGARPRAIAVGDVDGDGADDTIALTDSGTLAWPGHPAVDLGEDGAAVAVGDLDGDGCGEVLVALDLTPEIVVAGVPVCAGTCEVSVTVDGPETLTEGVPGSWRASADACGEEPSWSWLVDAVAPEGCSENGDELLCAFPDDDLVTIVATATTGSGEAEGRFDLQVTNAAPSIVPSAGVDVSGGMVTVDVPCGGAVQLELSDPGPADSVFVTPISEGNFRMDSFGAIEGPPFDDVGFFVADVQDDDGAVTTYDVEVSTSCGDDTGWTDTGWGDGGDVVEPNCCGACCWLAILVLFGGIRPVRVAALAAVGL